MAQYLIDRLAEHAVSGMKRSFAHRIGSGEDPTVFIMLLLNFFESNRTRSPQFLKKMASRIDSGFFALANSTDQIASPDDFIARFHSLVGSLLETNPDMPYAVDYDRKQALIQNQGNLISKGIRKEEAEKRMIVDNEYGQIRTERRREYNRTSGKSLRIAWIALFILAGICLLCGVSGQRVADISQLTDIRWFIPIPVLGVLGAVTGIWLAARRKKRSCLGCLSGHFLGSWAGGAAGSLPLLSRMLHPYPMLVLALLGAVLLLTYVRRLTAIELSSQEMAAYSSSLDSIEQYFAGKEKHETTELVLRILTTENRIDD